MLTAGHCRNPWPRGVTVLFGGIRAQGLSPNRTDRIREWGTLHLGRSDERLVYGMKYVQMN